MIFIITLLKMLDLKFLHVLNSLEEAFPKNYLDIIKIPPLEEIII